MFEWWLDLPWWFRYGLAIVLMGLGLVLLLVVNLGLRVSIAPLAGGFGLLCIAGRSESEKRGYHF